MAEQQPTEGFERSDMAGHYAELEVRLTAQEEHYVHLRTRGINPVAAARGAGYKNPRKAVGELAQSDDIERAIAYFREMSRALAIKAGAIEFTKDDATLLYLEAHQKAATATEEIKAVDSLVKLHGLAAPEKREIEINNREQLVQLSDEQLAKLAGRTYDLDPTDFVEVDDG